MNDSHDSITRFQTPLLTVRRWFALGFAFASIAFASCEKPTPATLQDAGKPPADLRAMLSNADPEVQARGALGLSQLGTEAKDAVPELIPLLKSKKSLVRQNAAVALAAIGPDAKVAVTALTESLKDSEWAVRRQAAIALGAIGRDAKTALPALARLDTDPQKVVRDAAKQARAKIEGK